MRSLVISLVSAAVAACYTGADVAPDVPSGADGTSVDDTTPIVGDLPCDVATIIADNCATCHGQPLSGGAPNRLLTHDDFAAPSKSDPAKTEAQLALERMKDAAKPMPPSGALPAAAIATIEAWVSGGLAKGTCAAGTANSAAVCTSGQTWRGEEGRGMNPGEACIACHSRSREGPRFTIAGTVYATAHEPDMCLGGTGAAQGASIVVTDANGVAHTLRAGSSGNFSYSSSIAMPYKAKVVGANGKERAMAAAQTNGDCNSCHTQRGANGAPGRIFAP
jgi:hypothetical protein